MLVFWHMVYRLHRCAKNLLPAQISLFCVLFPYMSFCYADEIVQFPCSIWEASLSWQPCITGAPITKHLPTPLDCSIVVLGAVFLAPVERLTEVDTS